MSRFRLGHSFQSHSGSEHTGDSLGPRSGNSGVGGGDGLDSSGEALLSRPSSLSFIPRRIRRSVSDSFLAVPEEEDIDASASNHELLEAVSSGGTNRLVQRRSSVQSDITRPDSVESLPPLRVVHFGGARSRSNVDCPNNSHSGSFPGVCTLGALCIPLTSLVSVRIQI